MELPVCGRPKRQTEVYKLTEFLDSVLTLQNNNIIPSKMTSIYDIAIPTVIRAMKNTIAFVKKGEKHALDNNIDLAEFTTARLHPDMKDFSFQIWRLTDAAKAIPPRLNKSVEPLTLPDVENTFPDLLARIEKTIAYLEALNPKDFEGHEQEEVVIKLKGPDGEPKEINFTGINYVLNFALPNFFFHVTTTYAILRMKGVDVGKGDYLNGAALVTMQPAK